MPVEHTIDTQRRAALVRLTGRVTLAEILADRAALFADPGWRKGFRILYDCTEVSDLALRSAEIRALVAQDEARGPLLAGSRFAVVARDDVTFGMSRMWATLSSQASFEPAVFRDLPAAMEWLGLEGEQEKS